LKILIKISKEIRPLSARNYGLWV